MIRIPESVRYLIETLEAHGYEAYLVGGCVRDSLLGRLPHDWDICTAALPEETIACFPDLQSLKIGIKHGTVTIRLDGKSYEVTTFRLDGDYSDQRRPDRVEFVRSLAQDLRRRDFTINAMAYHPRTGLVDCFGGQSDLQNKIIRCVGNPDSRFQEDALRILRALRFAAVYEFALEAQTAYSAQSNSELLRGIAVERIREEFCRLLCGAGASDLLGRFQNIFEVFLPELNSISGNLVQTLGAISNAPADLIVRLAILLHGMETVQDEQAVPELLKRLKFDRNAISRVVELVQLYEAEIRPDGQCVRRLLNQLGEIQAQRLINVRHAVLLAQSDGKRTEKLSALEQAENYMKQVLEQKQCYCLKDLAVNGNDLAAAGILQGKEVGDTLHKLLQLVIDGTLKNERKILLNWCDKKGGGKHEYFQAERNADCNGNQRDYSSECQYDG